MTTATDHLETGGLTIRRARPADRLRLAALLDRSFRLPLAAQIGPFLRGARIGDHTVIEEAGRITACVGLYPHTYRLRGVTFSTAAVGQVCTDPDFRGGGRMTALMRRILPLADTFDWVWLDGDRLRYGRYGWAPGGRSYRFTFFARHLPPPPAEGVTVTDVADAAGEIAAAFETAPQSVRFAPGETARLFRAGRGRDFQRVRLGRSFLVFRRADNLVVGGDGVEEELAALLASRLATRSTGPGPATVEVRCGPEPGPLLALGARRCAHYRIEPSNSYRVGALVRFGRRACRAARRAVTSGQGHLALRNADNGQAVVFECREGRLSARAARKDEPARKLTCAELSAFFFGLCPPESVGLRLPSDSPFRRVFPLPLHVHPLLGL